MSEVDEFGRPRRDAPAGGGGGGGGGGGEGDKGHNQGRGLAGGRDDRRGYPDGAGGGSARRDEGRNRGGRPDDRDRDSGYYGPDGREDGREGRDRSSSWRRDREDDSWWCRECRTGNDPRDDRCRRCGDDRGGRGGYSRRSRDRSPDHYGGGGYDDRRRRTDSFDDRRRYGGDGYDRRDEKRRRFDGDGDDDYGRGRSDRRSPRWPPPFEDGGASYVFDSRSGFFYDAASDFFYDPKNKMYFGNKAQAYFRFCPGESPPFKEVQGKPQDSAGPGGNGGDMGAVEPAIGAANSSEQQGDEILLPPMKAPTVATVGKTDKKKFAISLKSKKKLSGPSKKAGGGKDSDGRSSPADREDAQAAPAALPPKVAKQHEADMDKWSARGREMRKEEDAAAVGNGGADTEYSPEAANAGAEKSTSPAVAAVHGSPSTSNPDKVEKTHDGKPICGLCRRKFASLEKLRQHERVSALHKQNLAKKKAAEEAKKKREGASSDGALTAAAPAPPSADYRDRAKERRAMFGPDAAHGPKADEEPAVLGPSLDRARTVASTEIVAPQESLGESNIGNKMLQKLGWKKGGALGRKQDSNVSEGDSESGSARGGEAKDTLRADWERIESIAGGNSRMGQGGIGGAPHALRH